MDPALASPLGSARDVAGKTSTSHEFDMTNGEGFAMRVLSRAGVRQAADRPRRSRWLTAEVRHRGHGARLARAAQAYVDVEVQGAAAKPSLPFFDRGTWQQSVGLGP